MLELNVFVEAFKIASDKNFQVQLKKSKKSSRSNGFKMKTELNNV